MSARILSFSFRRRPHSLAFDEWFDVEEAASPVLPIEQLLVAFDGLIRRSPYRDEEMRSFEPF